MKNYVYNEKTGAIIFFDPEKGSFKAYSSLQLWQRTQTERLKDTLKKLERINL